MKLKYNAPVTLSFSLICAAVLAIDRFIMPGFIEALFTAEGNMTFRFDNVASLVRVLTHVFGHDSWEHLLNNLMLILLLGPILEEKHGSSNLIWMIFITALINGLINGLFFTTELLGASGVAFMMILLVSFVNIKEGEIPLTFLLVFVLYLFREIRETFKGDDISQIAHIVGGLCGSIFGFTRTVIRMKQGQGSASDSPVGGGQTIIG